MRIIGFTGKAGSGKDTAGMLVQEELEKKGLKVTKLSFAAKLKDCATLLWGWDRGRLEHDFPYKEGNTLDDGSPDPACEALGMTRREFMQFFGTEAMRNNIHRDVWVIALKQAIQHGEYDGYDVGLLTDCRFINELQFVRDLGGLCVQVIRTGEESTLTQSVSHVSELEWQEWKNWDVIVENNIDKTLSAAVSLNNFKNDLLESVLIPYIPEFTGYYNVSKIG